MNNDKFKTLTELGKEYGVSRNKVGKWLLDIGLRTRDERRGEMKPSWKAFNSDYVAPRESTQPGTYFYAWDAKKTKAALKRAGHKPLSETTVPAPPKPMCTLVGPYCFHLISTIGFEIRNSDGEVAVWVTGEANASRLVQIMNIAYQCGRLGPRIEQKAKHK